MVNNFFDLNGRTIAHTSHTNSLFVMKTTMFRLILLLVLGVGFGLTGCKEATPNTPTGTNQSDDDDNNTGDPDTHEGITYKLGIIPTSLPSMQIPEINQPTAAKIELGRHLFYDKRMSTTRQVSCGSCHDPEKGFADNVAVSPGI